jgi:hypothetical protein
VSKTKKVLTKKSPNNQSFSNNLREQLVKSFPKMVKEVTLEVFPHSLVLELLFQVWQATGTPIYEIAALFRGRFLHPFKTLIDEGVVSRMRIEIIPCPSTKRFHLFVPQSEPTMHNFTDGDDLSTLRSLKEIRTSEMRRIQHSGSALKNGSTEELRIRALQFQIDFCDPDHFSMGRDSFGFKLERFRWSASLPPDFGKLYPVDREIRTAAFKVLDLSCKILPDDSLNLILWYIEDDFIVDQRKADDRRIVVVCRFDSGSACV